MKEAIFCTYFDKYYLIKGLCMHSSLLRNYPKAQLWILCMDQYTREILEKLKLKGVKLISLPEFEDKELILVKRSRTLIEYYWTCTPSLPLYIFKKVKACQQVVYLDADLFFYSSLNPVFKEFGKGSIFVVEHRYPPSQAERINTSGRFNVGILIFRKDSEGLSCLRRWRKQCLDWCYWREEEGKMGDQLYLNEWPNLYRNLVISKNLGINIAPWNISQYQVAFQEGRIYVNSNGLICYHFHQFKIIGRDRFVLSQGYELSPEIKKYIYAPYIREVKKQIQVIYHLDSDFNAFDQQERIKFFKFVQTIPRIFMNKFKKFQI